MVLCAVKRDVAIDEELRRLIPPLTDEERGRFRAGKLGFEGFSEDELRYAKLIPTRIFPHYWIWVVQDLLLKIEEYSPKPTASCRIPWRRFRDVDFAAVPMEPMWEYPPPVKPGSEEGRPKHLYVIQSVFGGPVKIGMSSSPQSRIPALQPGNPAPLHVIRIYAGKGRSERAVHEALKEQRIHGEWFEECAVEILDEMMTREVQHGRS